MPKPLFPHTLQPENFSQTTELENCPPYWDPSLPESRTLDGWVESFFGSREDDFATLFDHLVIIVAENTGCEVEPEMIESIDCDDMDEMTQHLSAEQLHSLWKKLLDI